MGYMPDNFERDEKVLKIRNVILDNSGTYKCELNDESYTVKINVIGKLN